MLTVVKLESMNMVVLEDFKTITCCSKSLVFIEPFICIVTSLYVLFGGCSYKAYIKFKGMNEAVMSVLLINFIKNISKFISISWDSFIAQQP